MVGWLWVPSLPSISYQFGVLAWLSIPSKFCHLLVMESWASYSVFAFKFNYPCRIIISSMGRLLQGWMEEMAWSTEWCWGLGSTSATGILMDLMCLHPHLRWPDSSFFFFYKLSLAIGHLPLPLFACQNRSSASVHHGIQDLPIITSSKHNHLCKTVPPNTVTLRVQTSFCESHSIVGSWGHRCAGHSSVPVQGAWSRNGKKPWVRAEAQEPWDAAHF